MIVKGTVKFLDEQRNITETWNLENIKVIGNTPMLEDTSKCGYYAENHEDELYIEELKPDFSGSIPKILGTLVAKGNKYIVEE
jgi:hypothetical protein